MTECCTMSPGLESYKPAKYCLRFYDVDGTKDHILYFQMSTPFPRYEAGDLMMTLPWPLDQQTRLATVDRVIHGCSSSGDEVRFYQDVYCKFPLPVVLRQEDSPT
jgi:hypothetical protein